MSTQTNDFDDVGEFHDKFGLDNTTYEDCGPRTQLDPDLLVMRLNFLLEELVESVKAAGAHFEPLWDYDPEDERGQIVGMRVVLNEREGLPKGIDHPELFDGLIDLVYVAYGTAHLLGYPWAAGWERVQEANMAKVRAQSADQSTRGSTYDVVKPPGWKKPDIEGLLQQMGWDINNREVLKK